jgi:predicted Zn-dependent protease
MKKMTKKFIEENDENYVIINGKKIYLRDPQEDKKRSDLVIFPFGRVDNSIVNNVHQTLKNFFKKNSIDIKVRIGEKKILPDWGYRIGTFFDHRGFFDILRTMNGEVNFGITEVGVTYNGEKDPPRFGIGYNGVAIESTYRFRNKICEFQKYDFEKFKWRVGKESIKIVSLAYGMKNCKKSYCLLKYHHDVPSLDKGPSVCEECKIKFAEIVKQYHSLYEAILERSKQKYGLYRW